MSLNKTGIYLEDFIEGEVMNFFCEMKPRVTRCSSEAATLPRELQRAMATIRDLDDKTYGKRDFDVE